MAVALHASAVGTSAAARGASWLPAREDAETQSAGAAAAVLLDGEHCTQRASSIGLVAKGVSALPPQASRSLPSAARHASSCERLKSLQ